MVKIASISLLQLASLASIIGLYFSVATDKNDRAWWHWVILAVFVVITIVAIRNEIINYLKFNPKKYTNDNKILKYMEDWIKNGGRVAIFSRDMTWASGARIKKILEDKAEKGELILCLEKATETSDRLRHIGAVIATYGELKYTPRARFTIVDYDRHGSRVAIGAKINGTHIIQEFEAGSDILFAVTEDLTKLLLGFQDYKNDLSNH